MTSPNGHHNPADLGLDLDGLEGEIDPKLLAAIDLWHANGEGEEMPAEVRDRAAGSMMAAMSAVVAEATDGRTTEWAGRERNPHRPWLKPLAIGIVGGAALLAAAMATSATRDMADRRDSFIARNPDTIVATLRLQTQAMATCGNVAWSPYRDEIYVFAANVPANDPSQNRYTLWADTESASIELASFDVTNPVDEIVRLKGVPDAEDAIRFRITLDSVEGAPEKVSIEIATSDAF